VSSTGARYGSGRRPGRSGAVRSAGADVPPRPRRLVGWLVASALAALAIGLCSSLLGGALRRLSLPLADAGIIRAQAADKHLDPALIAAVIYAETKFDPRTSPAGALGLMQVEPETAAFIAQRSGGVAFRISDLATPAVNIAYGSWYLRYLLDHYRGAELPALAAYNAGVGAVDGWVAAAQERGEGLSDQRIPYPETRAYVERVLAAQQAYRATYPRQLGLR
jgi:soluble lytic murein transglycosylase